MDDGIRIEVDGPRVRQILDTKEAGQIIGLPATSVAKLARQSIISGKKVGGQWRFTPAQVEACRRRLRHKN